MRDQLKKIVSDLLSEKQDFILLTGDHGHTLFHQFAADYPNRFINVGIAEQNLIGLSSGLAKGGFAPIVYGLASILTSRSHEQIKIDLCFDRQKVILIGDAAGLCHSKLGATHQSIEDIAILRALPEIQIYSPSNELELEWSFTDSFNYNGPSYIRVGSSQSNDVGVNSQSSEIMTGMSCIKTGFQDKPIIFGTGSMVSRLNKVLSENEFSQYSLYSVVKIKPLSLIDFSFLKENLSYLIVVEEHNTIGGLGSAICELISCSSYNRKIYRIGIDDKFSRFYGSYSNILKYNGLDNESLIKKLNDIELKNENDN